MNIPTKKMPPRTDTRRVRLRTGESQRANGTYQYRWTTQDGVRHTIYGRRTEHESGKKGLSHRSDMGFRCYVSL